MVSQNSFYMFTYSARDKASAFLRRHLCSAIFIGTLMLAGWGFCEWVWPKDADVTNKEPTMTRIVSCGYGLLLVVYIAGFILAWIHIKLRSWPRFYDIVRWPAMIISRFHRSDGLLFLAGLLYLLGLAPILMWGVVRLDAWRPQDPPQPANPAVATTSESQQSASRFMPPADNRLLYTPATFFVCAVALLGVCTFINTLITRRLKRGEFRGVHRLLDEALGTITAPYLACVRERIRCEKNGLSILGCAPSLTIYIYDWTPCPGSLSQRNSCKYFFELVKELQQCGAKVEALCYSPGMVEEFHKSLLAQKETNEQAVVKSREIIENFADLGLTTWRTTEIGPIHFMVFSGREIDTAIVYAVKSVEGTRGPAHEVEGRLVSDDAGAVDYYVGLFKKYLREALRPREISLNWLKAEFTYCNQQQTPYVCLQIAPNGSENEDESPDPPGQQARNGRVWRDVWLDQAGVQVRLIQHRDTGKEKCARVTIENLVEAADYPSQLRLGESKIRLVYCSQQTDCVQAVAYSSAVSLSS